MLDKEDLQAIQELISASEERMTGKMQGMILESEERTSRSAAFLMEQEFSPKFNLLVERMQGIEEKLIPTSRVERLEDDVDLLKIVIRQMREEIDELKGA